MNQRNDDSHQTAPHPRHRNSRGRARTYEALALDDLPPNPKRCRLVLHLILRRHNWRHSGKHKGVSHKTMAERARFCFWLFDFLRDHPRRFKLDPRSFSGRHVEAVTRHWQTEAHAGRMSPATIQTYFSFMKTFVGWIGKPQLLKPIASYFDDPQLYRRSLASGIDKSWRARGVEVAAVIREVEAYDVHAAASLKLMQAFHLRFKESTMLRPHVDVLTAAQAGQPEDGAAFYLDTHRGTKGGRGRLIPIDNALRAAAIDYARKVAVGVNDSVSDPRLDLKQALRRLRYVMERHGITRAALGVTPHGLRHQGAAEDYEAMTGKRPPVAGGTPVDSALDRQARQRIADHLGHGRVQITNAYCGSRRPAAARSPAQPMPSENGSIGREGLDGLNQPLA
ncbi:integrase domain-containing protein [Pseudothauera rhizosphaerae]|uniref:Integrase catalytic domain-containing protein n=1 Tax=Pseudothauera rhizosphaerae TaxID=2565932 RepID=A0A4S4ALI0_9RHOO|nr:integrase domain-containing protein [Pseudothauera rhizosphaerae]THF60387.1 hypothetical protein E6O51_14395 [Pseudothauera rhizosphaerae]